MLRAIKTVFCTFLCMGIQTLYADFPHEVDFSLSTQILSDPPALPQTYGITLPNAWIYYSSPTRHQRYNPFLPHTALPMEVCVISNTTYHYQTQTELIQGCYRGDKGLQYLVLQPYQYMQTVTEIGDAKLIPSKLPMWNNSNLELPKILIFYRNKARPQEPLISIALGDFNKKTSHIVINGYVFQYNLDVMRAFHGLIYEMQDQVYLPENMK